MVSVVILILVGLLILLVTPFVAMAKAGRARRDAREATQRMNELESRLGHQQRKLQELENRMTTGIQWVTPPQEAPKPPASAEPAEIEQAPPLPTAAYSTLVETESDLPDDNVWKPRPKPRAPVARKMESEAEQEMPPIPPVSAKPPFSIEQFLGVKMFAWLGGVSLFFGVIFFVKYAFEHSLIPPALRVATGFITGAGLLVGGVWTQRKKNYLVLAQSLCATGVLVLYGVSYAAHAIYRFPAFNPVATFALMGLITVTAFLISIRFNALVVAVLGMLGGFLTPMLLPMVQDHPFALFSYIALLDAGLIAVTWYRPRWSFLTSAAAAGTILTQLHWVAENFASGRYFLGSHTLVPMGIFLFFSAMFLAATWWTSRAATDDQHRPMAAAALVAAALIFAFTLLDFKTVTDRTFLLYTYILLVNLAAIALAWGHPHFNKFQTAITGATFLHIVLWTCHCLRPEMLGSALAVYLVLGGLHAVWPMVAERLRPGDTSKTLLLTGMWIAPVIVALMALPLFVLPHVSFLLWPAVLLADLLAIGLAVAGGAILPVLAALVITLFVAAAWLFRVPSEITSLPPLLMVVVFFALLFGAAGVWLGKMKPKAADIHGPGILRFDTANVLPVASCSMPFLLLILMVIQLPVANPTPVFGAGLLLIILLLGLSVMARKTLLVPVAALCCLALEGAWHSSRFNPHSPVTPLAWYVGFYALFTVIPFVFRKLRDDHSEPWVASALSGIGHFMLIHSLVRHAWPNSMMGLLPAAFAVPSILSLLAVLRTAPSMDKTTQVRLSWLGGVSLLFITLVFPIQFDRQWLTVSWALEGASLVWLFRRVPHPGLLWTGLGLLAVSFVRLTVNPAVFAAYPRSGTAIFNWHLYTYGLVAIAQFLAAWWLPADRRRFQQFDLSAILWAMGGLLLFLLLNIEIADFFTAPGNKFVAFEFAGNFARDMTYTIAWGLFSIALLALGIWRQVKGARLAAIGLLGVTLLKLFLHDLSTIESIYRIAALIATGVIAFFASFLYQRFFARPAQL